MAGCADRSSDSKAITRLRSLAAMACVALLSATAAPGAARGDEKKITIAVEDEAAPWSLPDGTGYANDIVTAAFAAVGWKISLDVVPYARCKKMAIAGEVAGCFTVGRNQEVEQSLLFPEEPLFVAQGELYVLSGSPIEGCGLTAWPTISRLGVTLGYEYPPQFDAIKANPAVALREVSSEAAGLKMLAAKRLDVLLLSLGEGKPVEYIMVDAGVRLKLRKVCELGGLKSYIAFSPRHARGKAALAAFNRGYRIIRDNGTAAAIAARWQESAVRRASLLNAGIPGADE